LFYNKLILKRRERKGGGERREPLYKLEGKSLESLFTHLFSIPFLPFPHLFYGVQCKIKRHILTVLNKDDGDGLQVLHENAWLDVVPVPDTLIVNLGEFHAGIFTFMFPYAKPALYLFGASTRFPMLGQTCGTENKFSIQPLVEKKMQAFCPFNYLPSLGYQ
jgi:2OG-Fe(II) oxygenase superfamily